MVLGKEASVVGDRDVEASVEKDEVLTDNKTAFISKLGSVIGKKTTIVDEGTTVQDARAVPTKYTTLSEKTVTNTSKTVTVDETTPPNQDKKATTDRKAATRSSSTKKSFVRHSKSSGEKRVSIRDEKRASASDNEGPANKDTATRKKSMLGRGLMPGRGSMKGKGAILAKVPVLSKCREVTKVNADEVKVIVEAPDGRNPTITIKVYTVTYFQLHFLGNESNRHNFSWYINFPLYNYFLYYFLFFIRSLQHQEKEMRKIIRMFRLVGAQSKKRK